VKKQCNFSMDPHQILKPIGRFQGDDMADATAGIRDVASVAGYNVEVELRHGLARCGAIIEAEVETVGLGLEMQGQMFLSPADPNQEAGLFGAGQLLEPGRRAAGDDEGVAWGDRELVGDNGEEVIQSENPARFDFSKGRQFQRCVKRGGRLLHGRDQYWAFRCSSRHARLAMAG